MTWSLDGLQERSDDGLHFGRHGSRKAGGRMVVIRRSGLEALIAPGTGSILHGRDP